VAPTTAGAVDPTTVGAVSTTTCFAGVAESTTVETGPGFGAGSTTSGIDPRTWEAVSAPFAGAFATPSVTGAAALVTVWATVPLVLPAVDRTPSPAEPTAVAPRKSSASRRSSASSCTPLPGICPPSEHPAPGRDGWDVVRTTTCWSGGAVMGTLLEAADETTTAASEAT
jgi:hypothetical protein